MVRETDTYHAVKARYAAQCAMDDCALGEWIARIESILVSPSPGMEADALQVLTIDYEAAQQIMGHRILQEAVEAIDEAQ